MRLYLLRLGTIAGLEAPVPGYLIRTDDGTNVLVDTGAAADPSPDARIRVAKGQDVVAALDALGVRPDDIDVVVCSHLDPDHCGGHAAFPDAEFVIQDRHLALARAGTVPRLEAARRLWDVPGLHYRTVSGDVELLPGIELIESSGHVPGHQSVLVRPANTGPVLLAVDAIPMSAALDPDERPVFPFDMDEKDVRAGTRKLVDLARTEKAMLVHGHDARQWAELRVAPAYYD